jgi:hypothetical protein
LSYTVGTLRFARPPIVGAGTMLPHPPLQHAIVRRDGIADRSHRRAIHVQEMLKRCCIIRGNAGQRPRVGFSAQHHHAVLDLAVALVDDGKTLDLALA